MVNSKLTEPGRCKLRSKVNRLGMTWVLILIGLLAAFEGRAFAGQIHELARTGDLQGVKALINQNPGLVDARDEDGRTPLHWACRGVHLEVVRFLVDRGADCNAADNNQTVPLHSLAARNNAEAIEILLAKGALIDAKEYGGHTALHYAAMYDATDAAALLIEEGAGIETRNDYQRTPLLLCARERGGPETTRVLIEAGADVNARDKFQSTPLELAAWRGKEEVTDMLLDAGADIPSGERSTGSALILAASKGLTRLFDTVAMRGGDLSFMLPNGGTLLHSAASGGSVRILEILISNGLDINLRDSLGWTPLHYAARDGRAENVERLIAEGADINVRTIMGQSPLNIADEMKQDKVRALLIEKGAEDKPIQFPLLEGDYLGQKPPGSTPKLFAVGIVSSIWGLHSTVAYSPDGNTAMWAPMIEIPDQIYSTGGILMSERIEGRWTAPRFAPFAGDEEGDVPIFSADGKRVYFMSVMPLPGDAESRGERIWYVDRTADGWSEPRPVDPSVNDLPHHWQFGVDREQTIFFSSGIPEGYGKNDIYRSRYADGKWQEPENLGPPVNTEEGEETPFISPDGSYLLFSRQYDLYISYRTEDGGWTEPENLGEPINSPEIELCPMVTPDGKYMFFLSQRGGESHVWWVDARFIKK
jgi:ankyrin repeat protein